MAKLQLYLLISCLFFATHTFSVPLEDPDIDTVHSNELSYQSLTQNEDSMGQEKQNSIKAPSIFTSFQNVLSSSFVQSILSNETIKAVLSDPTVRGVLLNPTVQSVIQNPIVHSILMHPELQKISVLQNIMANIPQTSSNTINITPVKPTIVEQPLTIQLASTKSTTVKSEDKIQHEHQPSFLNMFLRGINEVLRVLQIQMEKRYLSKRRRI